MLLYLKTIKCWDEHRFLSQTLLRNNKQKDYVTLPGVEAEGLKRKKKCLGPTQTGNASGKRETFLQDLLQVRTTKYLPTSVIVSSTRRGDNDLTNPGHRDPCTCLIKILD